MSILKTCSNCIYFVDGIGEQLCCKFKNSTISTPRVFIPKEEVIRQDYKTQLIHDFREYIETVIKYYNSLCGTPDEYEYGLRKGFEMAIKYIIKYDYKEE